MKNKLGKIAWPAGLGLLTIVVAGFLILRCQQVQWYAAAKINAAADTPASYHPVLPVLAFHFKSSRTGRYKQLPGLLRALQKNGYSTVSLKQVEDFYYSEQPLPPKPVLLLITAGYRAAYKKFDHLLRKYDMRATIFILTKKLKQRDHHFVSWSATKKMADSPHWDVALHGHQSFEEVPIDKQGAKGSYLTSRKWLSFAKGKEDVEAYRLRVHQDFETSLQMFKEKLGYAPQAYAFAYGDSRLKEDLGDNNDLLKEETAQFPLVITRFDNGYNDEEANPRDLNALVVPHDIKPQALIADLQGMQPRLTEQTVDTEGKWSLTDWETSGKVENFDGQFLFSAAADQMGAHAWLAGSRNWRDARIDIRFRVPTEGQFWVVTHHDLRYGTLRVGIVAGQLLIQQLLAGAKKYHNLVEPKKIFEPGNSERLIVSVIGNRVRVNWGDKPKQSLNVTSALMRRRGRLALAVWSDMPGKAKVIAERVIVKRLIPRWFITDNLNWPMLRSIKEQSDNLFAVSPAWFKVEGGLLQGPLTTRYAIGLADKIHGVPLIPTLHMLDFKRGVPRAVTPQELVATLENVGAKGVHLKVASGVLESKSFPAFVKELSQETAERSWFLALSLDTGTSLLPPKELCLLSSACLASTELTPSGNALLQKLTPMSRLRDKLFINLPDSATEQKVPLAAKKRLGKTTLDHFRGLIIQRSSS